MKSSQEEHTGQERNLEKKVAELTETLQAMEEQMFHYEKMALLGQLIAGIAHEVNTPLAALNSNRDTFARCIEKIKSKLFDENTPESIREDEKLKMLFENIDRLDEVNKNASHRIVEIVNSVRRYARQDTLEQSEAGLNELLESTIPILFHEFKNRIRVHRDYGDIYEISCYPNKISQVFLNLLVNASHAIVGNGEIFIKTYNRENDVVVEIRDTGEGIAEEHLEKIFQTGFTTKCSDKGTGLGLALVRQMIEEHQGKIEVESKTGEGTMFRISFPRANEK